MPAQPTHSLAVQGHGGNPRYVIQNYLDGLPELGDLSLIRGNAPASVKRLVKNVFDAYGVGKAGCFASSVGESVRLVEVSAKGYRQPLGPVEPKERVEASTVAEVVISPEMLNRAGILHGGCIAYLIDICCATPLVVLGHVQGKNGLGVTQNMNISYHAPVSLGATIEIVSHSVAMGSRVMNSRCEVIEKGSGRIIASGTLNKMQPREEDSTQKVRL
ncbi:Thioesterase/thiol ester dehydrase-isomerase [Thelephora ganbajun]|uniref:Thioesterase/thiol ester dehydrase-isomerase n=1 Tax=Thelephora ganbajun TaxID=370292 RepID=A0ACB6ZC64_THEGA|nr:Thioesterase/thiol ester dehydrase-isomerase [Thelephora ganbajun]